MTFGRRRKIARKLTVRLLSFVIISLILLSGCGEATSAKNALNGFIEGLKNHDYRAAMVFVYERDSMTFDGDTERMMNAVADSLNVSTVSEGVSNMTVNVKTVDLRLIYRNASKAVIDEYYSVAVSGTPITDAELRQAIEEKALAIAKSADAPTVSTEIDLEMISTSGKWYINLDANSYNVFTGYLTSANDMMTDGSILSYNG